MPPLEPRSQEIPFTFGIDLSQDDEGQASGAEELENFDFDKDGAAVRRFGFTKASSGPLAGLNVPEVFVEAGQGMGLVSRTDAAFDLSSLATLFSGARVRQCDAATEPGGAYTCVVATTVREEPGTIIGATETYEVVYWVVNNTTGKVESFASLGTNTWGVQICPVYNSSTGATPGWAIYYASGTSTVALKYVKLAVANFLLGTPATVVASMMDNAGSTLPFAACSAPNLGSTYVAYVTVTTGQIVVVQHGPTGTQLATISPAGAVISTQTLANVWLLTLAAGDVCLFYQDGSQNLIFKRIASSLASVTATATIASTLPTITGPDAFTACELSAGNLIFFISETLVSAVSVDLAVNTYDTNTATLGSSVRVVGNAYLKSKAAAVTFDPNGVTYAVIAVGPTEPAGTVNPQFPNATLLAFNSATQYQPVGLAVYDEAHKTTGTHSARCLPSWCQTGSTRYLPQLVELETGAPAASGLVERVARVRLSKLTYGSARSPRVRASLGNQGYLAGSLLRAYDGQNLFPAAFTAQPQLLTLTGHATGGNLATGTYSYRSVLEFADINGTLQVSPPSQAVSVTLASAGTVDVVATSNTHLPTAIQGRPLRIKVYRTTLAAPSTYFLNRTYTLDPNTVATGSVASVSFTDNTSDAITGTGETLYTSGNALASELVPPLSFVCSHRNRLFGIDSANPYIIRFTEEISDATAPRWNAVLTLRVDNDGGPPLALASMNDKLFVLQRDQICVVTGEGPDALGSGAFSVPEVIAHIGVEPDQIGSVVETPVGVFFAHRSGIQLLTPDLQIVPVGKALGGKTVGTDVPVSFGRHIPTRQQVWFQTKRTGISAAPIYVYDLRFNRWLKWTGDNSWVEMLDIIDHSGVVYAIPNVTTGGGSYTVMQLTTSDYRDENPASLGSYVTFSQVVATPWYRGDRAQELRLWAVHVTGRKATQNGFGTDMVLQVYTQDERKLKDTATPDNSYTWLGSDTRALGTNWSVKARAVTQRCRAFRCRLTLTPSTSSSLEPYYTLSSITYDFGVLPGRGKVPAKGRPAAA